MGDRYAAAKLFNTAVQAVNDERNPNRATHAYTLFASACLTDPTWHEALFQAGNNCSDLTYNTAAIACYRRSLECKMTTEERGKAYTNLGWKLHIIGRTKEALEWSQEAVKHVPYLPYAWINLSCIHQTMGNVQESLRCAQEAMQRAPDDATVQTQHAFALLFNRKLASGLKAFESRFPYALQNLTQMPFPRWQGEEGKTLFLISDQGLGDTLCYGRFMREVCRRCKYVHAFIHPELMRAFTNAFVDVPNLNLTPCSTPYPAADFWTTFVSLPFALGLNDTEIREAPPVELPVYSMPMNWKVPDRKLHIGIHWAGSPLNKIDIWRNLPIDWFGELYRVPGIQLYSLQVGEKSQEMHTAGYSAIIRDMVPYIRDVVDTVSILQHLDFVIGCESALGHVCDTIGKEFWGPYSYMGLDYRCGVDGKDRVWQPTRRIFKMREHNNWRPVFEEIIEALQERVEQQQEKRIDTRICAEAI